MAADTANAKDDDKILGNDIKALALEAARFMTKAFRGTVDLTDPSNIQLLRLGPGSLAAYTRLEQTSSAREQTRSALAVAIADADGANRAEYLRLAMPTNPVVRALPAPIKPANVG